MILVTLNELQVNIIAENDRNISVANINFGHSFKFDLSSRQKGKCSAK